MSAYVSVKTKTGAYFYYKLVKGKKMRVSKSQVPKEYIEEEVVPKKKVVAKKHIAEEVVPKKKVAKKTGVKTTSAKKGKTTTQCLKVASLRKETKDPTITLKKWMENPQNVYVGRQGRIFIGTGDEKEIFHYKGSKFANPYKVGTKEGEYTLEESIKLYRKHLETKGLIEKAKMELQGKNLGCFCDQKGPCHAKVLVEVIED